MKKISLISLVLLIFVVGLNAQSYEYEDVVYLKNGGIIRGMIIEQIPNKTIKIETFGKNVFVYQFDEIEKITKEKILTAIRTPRTGFNSGYRGIIEAGLYAGDYGEIKLDIVNGVQISPYVFVGGGMGIRYDFDWGVLLPLFANARVYFINRKITPYVSTDLGYSFAWNKESKGGLYFAFTPGISIKITSKSAVNIGTGFGLQNINYSNYDDNNPYRYDYINEVGLFLTLNIGISF